MLCLDRVALTSSLLVRCRGIVGSGWTMGRHDLPLRWKVSSSLTVGGGYGRYRSRRCVRRVFCNEK